MNLGGFPNNPEDLFAAIFQEKKDQISSSKETLIALLLLALCLSCMVMGLFTLKKHAALREKEGGQLVSTLLGEKVAVIGLDGVIQDSFYSKSPFGNKLDAASVKKELLKAIDDKNIKGVLLRVNSPGGTVGASQELYDLVKQVKSKDKPVVVSMGDVCASGCYYLASAADKIVANSGTVTGSIGVISQGINFLGLFQKLGLRDQTIKAGKYKDMGSGYRDMTEEEKQIMQALLNDSYDQFLKDVENGRNIPKEELDKIAQGLIYTGQQAVKVNLVDELGTYEDSKKIMRNILEEKYNYKNASKITFEETWEYRRLSALEDIFGFGLSESLSNLFTGVFGNYLNPVSELAKPFSFSKYQPLWLME